MIEMRLPNGDIAKFPEGTPPEQIEAELSERFPPPRPVSLAPGEKAQRAHGYVTRNAEFSRFAVYDNAGKLCGFRQTFDAAIDFADALTAPPPPRRQPTPEPEPKDRDPIEAGYRIRADVDRAIRHQDIRDRRAAQKSRQKVHHRNRGTLDR
jgi:hypothetical protein